MTLSDRAVSYLRTIVPVLWGSLLSATLPSLPWLPAEVVAWLSGDAASLAVTALAIAAWYSIWRYVEPHIPDWLTRLVLGSAQAPAYPDSIETREKVDDYIAGLERLGHSRWDDEPGSDDLRGERG